MEGRQRTRRPRRHQLLRGDGPTHPDAAGAYHTSCSAGPWGTAVSTGGTSLSSRNGRSRRAGGFTAETQRASAAACGGGWWGDPWTEAGTCVPSGAPRTLVDRSQEEKSVESERRCHRGRGARPSSRTASSGAVGLRGAAGWRLGKPRAGRGRTRRDACERSHRNVGQEPPRWGGDQVSREAQSRTRLRAVWGPSRAGLRRTSRPGCHSEHPLSGASVSLLPLVPDKRLGAPSTHNWYSARSIKRQDVYIVRGRDVPKSSSFIVIFLII